MKTPKFAFVTKDLKSGFAILTLVFALNFETLAQYELLIKGQATSFDSAVAVRLDRFREEGQKLKLGQQLVDSLGQEVESLTRENALQGSIIQSNNFTIAQQALALHRKDSVAILTNTYFKRLTAIVSDEEKRQKILMYGTGVVIALTVIKLFTN